LKLTQNLDAWYNKGVALGKLNQYEGTIKEYEKAIEINPQLRSLANKSNGSVAKIIFP
jgi:tetratricopeptide (TPR) repeat protein